MENSVELTQNLQVTASENTNNSEIEAKSIEEENKISEEVTAETSKKEEKEVKTLDTNKPFKWTNEATKAAACMLKDIIDDYEKSSNSASLDEEISDPWGYAKLDKQMELLKQSKELDLFPEEWCRFKLASVIEKYFDSHCKSICNIRESYGHWYSRCNVDNVISDNTSYSDFHRLYFALCKLSKYNINFEGIAEGILCDHYQIAGSDDIESFGFFAYDDIEGFYDSFVKNLETSIIADEISSHSYYKLDSEPDEHRKKIEKTLSLPYEFQTFYLVDLIKKVIKGLLPDFDDIDEIKGLKDNSKKDYNLMLRLAECSYRSIDFLNLADAFLADQINGLKGLKETYADMF